MAATELECLALVLSLNHFRPYIWGRPVTVETDAAALRWLLSTTGEANTKFMRWALRLQEFDLTIQHRAGTSNGNADGFSRNPQLSQMRDRPSSPADEGWPEGTIVGEAPPTGVKFADSAAVDADHHAHLELGAFDGTIVRCDRGHPYKFNEYVSSMLAQGSAPLLAQTHFGISSHPDSRESGGARVTDNAQQIFRDEFDLEREPFEREIAEQVASVQEDFKGNPAVYSHVSNCAEYEYTLQLLADLEPDEPSAKRVAHTASAQSFTANTGVQGTLTSWTPCMSQQLFDKPVETHVASTQATTSKMPSLLLRLPNPPSTDDGKGQTYTPSALQRDNFKVLQRRDQFCSQVIKYLEQGEVPAQDDDLAATLLVTGEQYTLDEDGLLLHMNPSLAKAGTVALQLVAAVAVQPLLLKLTHADASALHPGRTATLARLMENYYWPGMGESVRKYVQSCVACQKRKPAHTS
jgi:hypothetical protein